MRFESFLLFIVLVFAGCANLEPAGRRTGLAAVEGRWIYSHTGKPSVWKQNLPDPSEFLNANMDGSRISIAKDGQASFLSPSGEGGSMKLRVADESDLLIRLEGVAVDETEETEEFSWTYDKKEQRLILPMNLKLPEGSTGTIPAYFRRER